MCEHTHTHACTRKHSGGKFEDNLDYAVSSRIAGMHRERLTI